MGPFPGQASGTRPHPCPLHGPPDDGRNACSGDTGLSGLRDRAVPENHVRASAARVPPLRAARPPGARAGGPEVHRSPGGDHRLRLHRPRLHVRRRAQPARLRRRSGVVVHGDAWIRRVARAVAVVQAVLDRMGAAARGGSEIALGARQAGGPRRAAPVGASSSHAAHGMDCRGGDGAHPHAGRVHLLQHQHPEPVPHRLRHHGTARRVPSGATDVTRVSHNPG